MAGSSASWDARSLVRWTLAALVVVAAPVFGQSGVGFVSLERILREAPAAKEAQKKLEREFSHRGQELSKLADQLKKMQENLEKNAVTMPESERQRRERELNDTNRDFQRRQREFNEDLGQRRKEEFDRVLERANLAVKQIAEAEKLDVVFQNEQVVWASTRIDITDKVIKALSDMRAGK